MRVRRSAAAIIVTSLLLLLSACDSPEQREAQHLEKGQALAADGELAKAAIEFRNALKINPTNVAAKFMLAEALEKQGNLPAALSTYQDVSLQDGEHRPAQIKLGQFALMNGDPIAAERYADKAISLAPEKADAYTMKAAALVMQRAYDKAEVEIEKSLTRAPNNADALIVLASQRMYQGRTSEAEKVVADGLKATPDDPMLLNFQANMLREMGRTGAAEASLRRLITLQTDNPEHVLTLAKDLSDSGRNEEAKQLFRDALANSADKDRILGAYAGFLQQTEGAAMAASEIAALGDALKASTKYRFLLARLNVEAKAYPEAAAMFGGLLGDLTVEEEKLDVRAELARIELLQGNRAAGAKQLDEILATDKGHHNALLLRANLALEDQRYDAAIADARAALNALPDSPGALEVLWRTQVRMGERSLAIDTLRTLTRSAPGNVEAHLQLASLLIPQAVEEAIEHLDAAIALAPERPELRLTKAQVLIYSKQESRGESIGLAMLQDAALAPIGHQILGEAAYARRDFDMAVREFQTALEMGRPFAEIGPKLTQALTFRDSSGAGNDAGDAVDMLEQRVSRDPRDSLSLILLANLRQNAGNLKGAETALRQAIEVAPDNPFAHLSLSRVLRQMNRLEEMNAVLARAERQFPDDRTIQESAAVGREIAGTYDAARIAYERVLATWPDSLVAANNLAQLAADVWPEDRELLNQARQRLEKFRNDSNPVVLDTLGWVQVRLGNTDDAVFLLQRAASMTPDSRDAQYHYGVALAQKGLDAKAREALTKALADGAEFRGREEAEALLGKLKTAAQ